VRNADQVLISLFFLVSFRFCCCFSATLGFIQQMGQVPAGMQMLPGMQGMQGMQQMQMMFPGGFPMMQPRFRWLPAPPTTLNGQTMLNFPHVKIIYP